MEASAPDPAAPVHREGATSSMSCGTPSGALTASLPGVPGEPCSAALESASTGWSGSSSRRCQMAQRAATHPSATPAPATRRGQRRRGSRTVLSGRSSAYGRGITYQPLAQMLGSYPGGWPALAAALSDAEGALAVRSLATIMNEAPATGQVGVEDHLLGRPVPAGGPGPDPHRSSWSGRRPLHQSEQTLLDLVDDIATWLNDVTVLVLCVARTELLGDQARVGAAASPAPWRSSSAR